MMPSPPSVANLMGDSLSDESTVYTRTPSLFTTSRS